MQNGIIELRLWRTHDFNIVNDYPRHFIKNLLIVCDLRNLYSLID